MFKEIGLRLHIWRLSYWLSFHPKERKRKRAAIELGALNHPRTIAKLIRALGDKHDSVRIAAANALGNSGDPRALDPLIRLITERREIASEAVVNALGKLGPPAFDPLVRALGALFPSTRQAAAKALGRLGDARAIDPLIRALGDLDGGVRWALAKTLVGFGPPVVDPLIQALQGGDCRIRRGAAEALGRTGDKRAVDPLLLALKDRDDVVRLAATVALGQLGDERAVDPLLRLLVDSNVNIYRDAAKALAALSQPEWCQWVRDDLYDFACLRESQHPAALALLLQALGYPFHNSSLAAKALIKRGGVAVDLLLGALEDGRVYIDSRMVLALVQLSDKRVAVPLIHSLKHVDQLTRREVKAGGQHAIFVAHNDPP